MVVRARRERKLFAIFFWLSASNIYDSFVVVISAITWMDRDNYWDTEWIGEKFVINSRTVGSRLWFMKVFKNISADFHLTLLPYSRSYNLADDLFIQVFWSKKTSHILSVATFYNNHFVDSWKSIKITSISTYWSRSKSPCFLEI